MDDERRYDTQRTRYANTAPKNPAESSKSSRNTCRIELTENKGDDLF